MNMNELLDRQCGLLESRLSLIEQSVRALRGWRLYALCLAAGALLSFSMPPYGVFALLWVCFPVLVWALRGCDSLRRAFAVGWTFAFGFLTCSLYWIAASMFVDIAHFWWAVPLAVAGLPALFGIYYGLAAMLAVRVGTHGLAGTLTVGLCWFLADVARSTMFTGFPWNIFGYAWANVLPVMQLTSVIGIHGLGLFTLLAAVMPTALAPGHKGGRHAVALAVWFFVLAAGWGHYRLEHTSVADVPGVRLRLVQPNIPQSQKWRMDSRAYDFQSLLDLTAQPAAEPPTHIFWPETASTYYLAEDDYHRKAIAAVIPAAATVMTGVIRRNLTEDRQTTFFNSLVAVDGLGRIVAGYDKVHLVPFGEFMPLRKYLPLNALAAGDADFSAGPGARSLRVLGLPPFSPLICYESIFSGAVVDRDDRPEFLLNVTNDGWYGDTIGPYQHLAIASVRAIEEGIPLVRVANTGISAIFDPTGRVIKELGLNKTGIIDTALPTYLPLTFFASFGHIPVLVAFVFMTVVAFLLKRRN
jgi:apolipoprotein N-acyltransferase